MSYILLNLFVLSLACGQSSVGLSGGVGGVIKHKSGLTFDIPDRATEWTLSHRYQVSGRKAWHHYWHMPSISHLYQYVNYGDNDVLGSVHALMRGIDIAILRRHRWQVSAHLYSGVGIITQTYDYIDNPTNNAVGSTINNATRLGLTISRQVSDRWAIRYDAHLLHTSNGLYAAPNSGINSWGTSLGLSYSYKADPAKRLVRPARDTTYRRLEADLQLHYGRTEHAVPNGPKYPHYVLSGGLAYRYHSLLTVLVGADYEYAGRTYAFHFRDFQTKKVARRRAQRMAIWAAHEFTFDRIVFRQQLGYYLDVFSPVEQSIYFKLGVFYRLPLLDHDILRLGVVLKSHGAVADHASLVLGLRL